MNQVNGYTLKSDEITIEQRTTMFGLMLKYFDNVDESKFNKDLDNSHYVIVLEDVDTKNIVGFSTQTIMQIKVEKQKIIAIYSGDTIIDEQFHGSRELPKAWVRLFASIMKNNKDCRFYWFLISKGYMTYLMMPRYFGDFFPRYDKAMPSFEKKVLDALAIKKFGQQYDPSKGLVYIDNNYYLKKEVGQINQKLLENPHIKFFIEKNPEHTKGVELACIVPLSLANMNDKLKNLLKEEP